VIIEAFMGQMIEGVWHAGWYEPDKKGAFVRPDAVFRGRVVPEAGRYHLYVSYACPWAHRTIITRKLRGLEDVISMTVVNPRMGDDGWVMDEPDPVLGKTRLQDVYREAKADYTGRVTVPILWDKKERTIVNNESREVMRMLDRDFDSLATKGTCLAPLDLVEEIDETLTAIYQPINNGVYRCGFATKQEAYEKACRELFAALDRWEEVLGEQRYLCGDRMTEADIALFTTLLRFDLVYYSHFKCNVRRIQDYPNLWGFLRDMYQAEGVAETCNLDHIKVHYYWSQTTVNPHRIVPLGPSIDLSAPHGRARH
jgi:glutathionyl-hydroquinone reductase